MAHRGELEPTLPEVQMQKTDEAGLILMSVALRLAILTSWVTISYAGLHADMNV